MYVGNIELVTVIVIIFFAVPILAVSLRQRRSKPLFDFIIKVLNRAFIFQFIVGVLMSVAAVIIDKTVFQNGYSGVFFEVFGSTVYVYVVVGLFYYFPALCLLNLANWIVKKVVS